MRQIERFLAVGDDGEHHLPDRLTGLETFDAPFGIPASGHEMLFGIPFPHGVVHPIFEFLADGLGEGRNLFDEAVERVLREVFPLAADDRGVQLSIERRRIFNDMDGLDQKAFAHRESQQEQRLARLLVGEGAQADAFHHAFGGGIAAVAEGRSLRQPLGEHILEEREQGGGSLERFQLRVQALETIPAVHDRFAARF